MEEVEAYMQVMDDTSPSNMETRSGYFQYEDQLLQINFGVLAQHTHFARPHTLTSSRAASTNHDSHAVGPRNLRLEARTNVPELRTSERQPFWLLRSGRISELPCSVKHDPTRFWIARVNQSAITYSPFLGLFWVLSPANA